MIFRPIICQQNTFGMMEPQRCVEKLTQDIERKRRKQKKTAAKDGGQWDRCMFKIVRKNRYCNILRVPGSLFCGNHLPIEEFCTSKKKKKYKATTRRRVPCPVDASHTVYEFDLAKHVLVCNRVKDAEIMRKLPFYSHNINSGTHFTSKNHKMSCNGGAEPKVATGREGLDEHLAPSVEGQEGIIDRLVSIDFRDMRKRIEAAYDSCVGELALEKLRHECCDLLFDEKRKAGASKSLLRHLEQQASIIGHMEQVKLLQDSNAAFVELGAGRGMLSLALAQMFPESLYVLIDRAHTRGKADRFIGNDGKSKNAPNDKSTALRVKIDIRHLNLGAIPEISDKPIVCMSKHLCGVATDLSLRAITKVSDHTVTNDVKVPLTQNTPASVSSRVNGLAIALCCHHVCEWEDYVNPKFLKAHGFKAEEFKLLTSMTSWTTCGMGLEGDAVEDILGIRFVNVDFHS
ncbi:hypothetical protein PsorP6_014179 [Peronosclerospora sorghi]|uniref:Uncharacterized protein n=1 Tax=Peronosclerospora sorghi TaxID=230839 RepID=A0ACC0VIE7_9STRA|nr:hypothetical protein PsorP6_014179 [Peronosclerospora sorghi]